ncbi:DNA invertase Pin-like site-specific DNA recombinase [Bradyrhizobium sp. AZCC 1678]|uniref:recombinase family protein n=1 Tax=Bradyrhizobium sp. AZCC 1678 TaxID=3117030 RepID=UPI002FF2B419
MVNALVIRRNTQLEKAQRALRAAQYVRMSTDYQRYSIQNQAAAIAVYAHQRNLTIVRNYVDEGRSGLRIKGRPGLIELIEDVQSGHADFDHILVYDVSRWGRFQDVDESAHYEFVCKQNGVKVAYCAEQFDNDGSLLSSIVKNIKRVMAAEYSRELSVKVHTGQSRIAGLGYRVGGPLTFGLRRELVDANARSKCGLAKGERKSLQTDRVRLQAGSDDEAAIVRWIFHQFVIGRQSDSQIARELNQTRVTNQGRSWTDGMIHTILKNENYIGNVVYNRTSRRLGQKLANNPHHNWIRGLAVIDPIVDPGLFARAQKIMAERRVEIAEDQMLLRLRATLHRKGKLNSSIINNTAGLPSVSSYTKHFGTLRKVYALLGYVPSRDCDWIDTRLFWSDVLAKHATQMAEALSVEQKLQPVVEQSRVGLTINGKLKVTFLAARHLAKRGANHAPQWRAHCSKITSGLLVVLRLNEANKAVQDYVVLPASGGSGAYVRLSDAALIRQKAARVDSLDELIREIKMGLIAPNRVAPAMPAAKSKRRKPIRPKTTAGHARR